MRCIFVILMISFVRMACPTFGIQVQEILISHFDLMRVYPFEINHVCLFHIFHVISIPMVDYYQVDPWEYTSVRF